MAKYYSGRVEIRNDDNSLHRYLMARGLMDDLFPLKNKPHNYWTKAKCRAIAVKVSKRYHFQRENRVAYEKSIRMGWIEEFFPE